MVRVVESVKHGIHCGVKCANFTLFLAYFYLWISLAFTLTARLYLRAYYHSAHMAGLSVIIALFVISHHTFPIRRSLNCGYKVFNIFQCILNTWYLLLSAAAGVCYAVLVAFGVHLNHDYLGALIWSFVNMLFMLYLLVLTGTATRGGWYSRYNLRGSDKDWVYYHHDKTPGSDTAEKSGDASSNGGFPTLEKPKSSSSGCCKTCCRVTWSVVYGFCYTLFHLLFMVAIFLTAYHPATVLDDVVRYRNADDMYTVKVEGHKPLALYMRCRGNGSETIVYENGLGGLANMAWDFIPKYLEDEFTVCVHDRRGYGWSESWESDDILDIINSPQWALTNAYFFKALVDEAGIKKPFFYMGHSYGGFHITYTALTHPDMIKGLIFLDTARFSSSPASRAGSGDDTLRGLLEVIVNFQPLGLLRAALDLKILDYAEAFRDVGDFDDIEEETSEVLVASARSGYYFTSFLREQRCLYGECPMMSMPRDILSGNLANRTVDKPVFVVDAGSYPHWFKEELKPSFPRYNMSFGAYVAGASHETLVYSSQYSSVTAQLVRYFVQYVSGKSTFAEFDNKRSSISGRGDASTQ